MSFRLRFRWESGSAHAPAEENAVGTRRTRVAPRLHERGSMHRFPLVLFALAFLVAAPVAASEADAELDLAQRARDLLEVERVIARESDPLTRAAAERHRERLEHQAREAAREELNRDRERTRDGVREDRHGEVEQFRDVRVFDGRVFQREERRGGDRGREQGRTDEERRGRRDRDDDGDRSGSGSGGDDDDDHSGPGGGDEGEDREDEGDELEDEEEDEHEDLDEFEDRDEERSGSNEGED